MGKQKEESGGEELVRIELEYIRPDTPVPFANHMVVQRDQSEFHISFFQVNPPIFLGNPEKQAKKAREIKSIRANCVASVTVAEGRMPAIIRALKANYERNCGPLPDEDETPKEEKGQNGKKVK